jgi:flagellar basal-body rod modification protein FlgD
MSVNPAAGSVSTPSSAASTQQRDNTGLDKDSFLKILVGQLQNMDPMSASSQDPSQMIGQMTQYSILEQLQNLSTSSSDSLNAQKQTQSLALLGKTVGYKDADGNDTAGLVQQVDFGTDGTTKLTLAGGIEITPGDVLGVQ